LAVGYTLDEISNDITKMTPASFEPVIDYVVTKIPRWAFEKFPGTSGVLGTQMQSVGEAMSIGRTFAESLQKALRSLENGRSGLNCDPPELLMREKSDDEMLKQIAIPTPERIFQVGECVRRGISRERIYEACRIDYWFLDQMSMITDERAELDACGIKKMTVRSWRRAKRIGFSDSQLAYLWKVEESSVRASRIAAGVIPTYKAVDTCSAEFAAQTPYHYSTYEDENEVHNSTKPKVIILGSGPNRIGQGIEFDYCCVHASFALRDAGFETIMVNCNPETVSTDYDTSDRLYFEPLTQEDVMNVIEAETLAGGVAPRVIVGLGGQTPLKLANQIPVELIAGTSPHSIDIAEDRKKWSALCEQLKITQPPGGTALSIDEAKKIALKVGYPVLVRPSYVLGGRAMQIVHDEAHLERAMHELTVAGTLGREGGLSSERPVLIDRFLDDATEIDVDAIRDSTGEVLIGAVMEHVEEAGVHSGDSACVIPPPTLEAWVVEAVESYTKVIANALDVRGLINVQFAVASSQIYVIEANPRASRTVPFVAKATGVPLAKIASRVMLGASLAQLRTEGILKNPVTGKHVSVKEAVLPFSRFPEVDTALGPEMRSTGEVMGIDSTFGRAFVKAEIAAGTELPTSGMVFLSLNDRDKPSGLVVAKRLRELGLGIAATTGTADYLQRFGHPVDRVVGKVSETTAKKNSQPDDAVELIKRGEISFVINTPQGRGGRSDGEAIRKAANIFRVSSVTTINAALAAMQGLFEQQEHPLEVKSLQEYHQQ
jgi:carbamoyl-phosphate synthase large subunit